MTIAILAKLFEGRYVDSKGYLKEDEAVRDAKEIVSNPDNEYDVLVIVSESVQTEAKCVFTFYADMHAFVDGQIVDKDDVQGDDR